MTLNILRVSPSPHAKGAMTTQRVMSCVILALMPSVISAGYYFGLRAIMLIALCIMACVVFEGFSRIIMKKEQTIGDMSAVLTGLLLALNLPVTIPFWQASIGCFVAIVIVKQLFGGLGQNFANPAIVGRIVLMLSFTSNMTTWALPKYYNMASGCINGGEYLPDLPEHVMINGNYIFTGATPLVSGSASYKDLFLGNVGGCIGETCALALLIGGIYLIIRGIISPAAPVAFIGTVFVLDLIAGNDAVYNMLAGGLFLGAFFMATDYVTTPITVKGKLVFGIGCGVITFLIRQFGSYPEGVSFSILLMNIVTPYIDRFTMTKPFGAKKEAKAK